MKPFETPGQNPELLRYSQTARLVRAAGAACAGEVALEHGVFDVVPLDSMHATWEPGNVLGERQDMAYAFTTAFYAPGYGPAASETVFQHGDTIEQSLKVWNSRVTDKFNEAADPAAFERLFFEGGLWKVVVDPAFPGWDAVRAQLDQPDFGGLRQDRSLLDFAEMLRQDTVVRNDLPHLGSHRDLARFANTVLHIGLTRMRITDESEIVALLERSLPEAADAAFLGVLECNNAFAQMANLRDPNRAQRKYVTIDYDQKKVGLNHKIIMRDVNQEIVQPNLHVRRGCPAVFMRTPFEGKQINMFRVLNKTLVRMYRETGALTNPKLRRIGTSI